MANQPQWPDPGAKALDPKASGWIVQDRLPQKVEKRAKTWAFISGVRRVVSWPVSQFKAL